MMIGKKIKRIFGIFATKLFYGLGRVGRHAVVYKPTKIDNPKNIELGQYATVMEYGWLIAPRSNCNGKLRIGDYSVVGHFSHIVSNVGVTIGEKVLLADKVFISDCTHEFSDIESAIMDQNVIGIKSIYIGDGSWIGEHACVLGASIGKHCVIGANSVVLSDLPDYSIAVGSPAKVIKRYDINKQCWINI